MVLVVENDTEFLYKILSYNKRIKETVLYLLRKDYDAYRERWSSIDPQPQGLEDED